MQRQLPFSETTGYVTIPKRIREQYVGSEAVTATVQAAGVHLHLRLRAASDVLFRIRLLDWATSDELQRSLNRGRVHVARWSDYLKVTTESDRTVVPADVEVL